MTKLLDMESLFYPVRATSDLISLQTFSKIRPDIWSSESISEAPVGPPNLLSFSEEGTRDNLAAKLKFIQVALLHRYPHDDRCVSYPTKMSGELS